MRCYYRPLSTLVFPSLTTSHKKPLVGPTSSVHKTRFRPILYILRSVLRDSTLMAQPIWLAYDHSTSSASHSLQRYDSCALNLSNMLVLFCGVFPCSGPEEQQALRVKVRALRPNLRWHPDALRQSDDIAGAGKTCVRSELLGSWVKSLVSMLY